ncbi:carbohydrate porin [Puia sp.]|jgi:high affinity Mn2+ porin|uniref:carbohydrate porin n=1 Tax=Puia sp. TaxID=2045100 RepID=UPI002F42D092
MILRTYGALFMTLFAGSVTAQTNDALFKDSGWSTHFQFTGVVQGYPHFSSPYSGQNSLQPNGQHAYSVTTTAYLGHSLWKGASLFWNPEMAGGRGVSSTLGIAGFPNGETFRIGNPEPTVYTGRLFLRQHIFLDKDHFEQLADDQNQLSERVSTSRITLTLGKFSLGDFFDGSNVSHDPRMDFMNWAFMNNGAYDYAANTRGYTFGFVAELVKPSWTLRVGTALEPIYANGPDLDEHYFHTNSENVEFEKRYTVKGHKGVLRLLGYYNINHAPKYRDVINEKLDGTDTAMDVIFGKKYGGRKPGFGINGEQELGSSVSAFLRLGWNNGKTATWAFAEIDNTVSGGIRIYGDGWKRKADNIGVALMTNGISNDHRDFLAAGGYGFMIGDGRLPNYGREDIAEIFYECKLFANIWGTLDYQFVEHPAYNRDRGPVSLFAARAHVEF